MSDLTDYEREFAPLPYYPFTERPETLPLTQDEAATAIHLSDGHLPRAAALLKVPLIRLSRLIRHSPHLQRVLAESSEVVVARAASKYIEALEDPDSRRQEWGASKIMQSRAAIGHIFSPAPAANIQSNASLTIGGERKTYTFRWRTDADDQPAAETIEHDATGADD